VQRFMAVVLAGVVLATPAFAPETVSPEEEQIINHRIEEELDVPEVEPTPERTPGKLGTVVGRLVWLPTRTPTPTPLPTATPVPPSRTILAKVTAYCLRGRTYSGTFVRDGVVAVDPRVIPLGSVLRIDGFGSRLFVAEDTGGGVRGNHIDVWFSSCDAAIRWGVQERQVKIW
jgi:3D (Asp-Asp-Asp) domain-containing protein